MDKLAPFSGDLGQFFNYWTSWLPNQFRGAMGQLGFININELQSDDHELEQSIVENRASYGKQLGRIVEALQAVCENSDIRGWTPDQQRAMKDFIRLAEEIDEFKHAHRPVKESVADIAAVLRKFCPQKALERSIGSPANGSPRHRTGRALALSSRGRLSVRTRTPRSGRRTSGGP